MTETRIRAELAEDREAIHSLNVEAFGQRDEAELIDRLRLRAPTFISLVAEGGRELRGHILFTPVTIDGQSEDPRAAGLAPMAVAVAHQRRGIGSKLVEKGLEACRARGFEAAVVLGHPAYYPRFGFRPASRWGLRYESEVPDEAFLALELVDGALGRRRGVVRYDPEFSRL